jgi:hypothetical protein
VDGPPSLDPPLPALRVLRNSVKAQHGETGFTRQMDIDVSGYRHLWLSAWVRVDFADLSGGGTLGSEYPMKFHVQYEGPQQDSRPDWSVGFYTSNPDNLPIPEGSALLWPQGQWQEYQVDLMNTDASRMPYRLLELDVMGQGHSYDARVADIQLIGD